MKKKKSTSQSAFFELRASIGLFLVVTGVFLALLGIGQFSAQAQPRNNAATKSINSLVPAAIDCSQLRALGIDKQENLGAGATMIYCGEAEGGSPSPSVGYSDFVQKLLAPLAYGGADVDLITGTDSISHPTQSETYTLANPDNPNQIVVTYNDSRTASANYSGASYSSDGGTTFTRLNPNPFSSGHGTNYGDPVTLYNKPTGTFHAIFLATGCGGQGIGDWTSTDGGATWAVGACVHSGGSDDRESGWSDNNPSSPFYGRMYVSWNDFAAGGNLKVRYSTDNGLTWPNERQLAPASPFIRNTQITGDPVTGTLIVAGMDEGGGGFPHNNINHIYRSTDGGATWSNTYTGPAFPGPGVTAVGYFACMFSDAGGYWRHEGWGEPATFNNVVHLVYAQHGAGADAGDVYYIRSTDGGVTFSAPFKLNTDSTTRPQWQPNISVSPSGTVFATWYDGRDSAVCTKGNPAVPCYRMYSRKSLDNGATWLSDDALSDVVSPLPGQPDSSVQSTYAGDYDYGSAIASKHLTSWDDGRVTISGQSQQDAFTDSETTGGGGGGANLVSAASRLTQGSAGTFDIDMPLSGTSGVEDRDAAGNFLAVFTFDAAVTSGNAQVVGGTATAGTPTFSGNEMRVPLTNVADVQTVTVEVSGVNGGGATSDVDFGFLIGDVDGNRTVAIADDNIVKTDRNQVVTGSNFRDDINLSGVVDKPDHLEVKNHAHHSLP
ncbi:MAG: sialidase family protein [Chthoniobacterales bacterium]